jgi:cyanophycinase-like exopeptidase
MTAGRLILMGSGEISPTMVSTHRRGLEAAQASSVTFLDSPFGFQENADELTEKIAEFFRTSLSVDTKVATLRRRGLPALEIEQASNAVRTARYVFAGPGSPSYALSVWREARIGARMRDVLTSGGTVTLASAAALTAGLATLPVYEIYKVGADAHWLEGLDLTAPFGMSFTVIPHWNNAEGGTHDTSRCYVGERRLAKLEEELSAGILGIDEHTAATLDFAAGRLRVSGASTVTLRGPETLVLESGDSIELDEVAERLAASRQPASPHAAPQAFDFDAALDRGDVEGAMAAMLDAESGGEPETLRSMIVTLGEAARSGLTDPREVVGGYVDLLLELRSEARAEKRFEVSDRIRDRLIELGVEVHDTPEGVEWELS